MSNCEVFIKENQNVSAEVDNCRGREARANRGRKKESKQTNKSVVDKIKISDPLENIDTNDRADLGNRRHTTPCGHVFRQKDFCFEDCQCHQS